MFFSFPMSRLYFFDVIGLFVKARTSRVNAKQDKSNIQISAEGNASVRDRK